MKTLTGVSMQKDEGYGNSEAEVKPYANMPPEAPMYLPSVLKTPAVPAPYWKIVTVPLLESVSFALKLSFDGEVTVNETHNTADS